MSICKLCCDKDAMKGRNTKIVLFSGRDGEVSFYYCECLECGARTEFCLTDDEAKKRMQAGWVIGGGQE